MERSEVLRSDLYAQYAMAAACQAVAQSGVIGTLTVPLAGLSGVHTTGYEIHMGDTCLRPGAQPFQTLTRGETETPDGCQGENAYGTYQHGVFDDAAVASRLIGLLAARKGVTLDAAALDTTQYKETQYDKLADTVRNALDMDLIYRILEGNA